MNVEIIAIGNLKEGYLREAEREYLKRLTPYCSVSVTELKEARLSQNAGLAEESKIRQTEGAALLAAARKKEGAYVVALDMRGDQLTSEEFASQLERLALDGTKAAVFLIGGSLGLPETVREKADMVLSFSKMTFPHQLMRVILEEQIYRAYKIRRGEPYHK